MSGWLSDGSISWSGRPVARTVVEAEPRRRVALTGTLTSVAACHQRVLAGPLRHADPRPCLQAELDDGTGIILLRWLGRDRIAGIAIGASLRVEGTVLTDHGRRVVLNPLSSLLE